MKLAQLGTPAQRLLAPSPTPLRWLSAARNLSCLACMLCTLGWLGTSPATSAQPPATPPVDLTEGLLDLLNEPSPPPAAPPTAGSGMRSTPGTLERGPDGVPLDGSDTGAGAAHPLSSIRRRMLLAADLLPQRQAVAQSRQAQAEALNELDRLIEQLEQMRSQPPTPGAASAGQSGNNPQSQSASGEPDSSGAEHPSQSADPAAADRAEQQAASNPNAADDASSAATEAALADQHTTSGEGDQPSDQPGDQPSDQPRDQAGEGSDSTPAGPTNSPGLSAGRARTSTLPLQDPRWLQQNAWGSLPQRKREQMQSRMVEQFLPAYRQDIEAYYRALAQ
jgi:hypothetical protein